MCRDLLPGKAGLSAQWVRFQRELVTAGRWAKLWSKDDGLSTSLCPVLALLSRGYQNEGGCARLARLASLTGLSKAELRRARLALRHSGLIEWLPGPERGVWSFRQGPGLLESKRRRGFRFPGSLVHSGRWAEL